MLLLLTFLLFHLVHSQNPWDSYILAPSSRTIPPTSINRTTGDVYGTLNMTLTLSGKSSITFDFSILVSGFLSFNFLSASDSSQSLNISFTESPLFIGPISDDSTYPTPSQDYDGAYILTTSDLKPNTTWTLPSKYLRGGFRYATLTLTTPGRISLSNPTVYYTASPHIKDLRAYTGYFHSSSHLLNRIWYAGAYTVQTNIVSTTTGRQIPTVKPHGWANNASLGVGDVTIVDGAKRDRAVWPGDMGIAVPTIFVTTSDFLPVRNALKTMVETQDAVTGALVVSKVRSVIIIGLMIELRFAECGPPLLQKGSDTYHMWTLIGVYYYYREKPFQFCHKLITSFLSQVYGVKFAEHAYAKKYTPATFPSSQKSGTTTPSQHPTSPPTSTPPSTS